MVIWGGNGVTEDTSIVGVIQRIFTSRVVRQDGSEGTDPSQTGRYRRCSLDGSLESERWVR